MSRLKINHSFLYRLGEVLAMAAQRMKFETEYRFFIENVLSEYEGQWIAIKGKKVVVSGTDPGWVVREVAKRGIKDVVYTKVPDPRILHLH